MFHGISSLTIMFYSGFVSCSRRFKTELCEAAFIKLRINVMTHLSFLNPFLVSLKVMVKIGTSVKWVESSRHSSVGTVTVVTRLRDG